MLIFLILSVGYAAVTINVHKTCTCEQYKAQADCKNPCNWSGTACVLQKCEAKTQATACLLNQNCIWQDNKCVNHQTVCTDFKTEKDCDTSSPSFGCVWNGTACAAFTKCSDYKPGTSGCPAKSRHGKNCELNAAKTACEEKGEACSTFTAVTLKDKCVLAQGCVWTTTCAPFSSCSSAGGVKDTCISNKGCFFGTDNKCRAKTCADVTAQAECSVVLAFDGKSGSLCSWTNGKCADANDTAALTAATCNSVTLNTYSWTDNHCIACQTWGALLAVGMMVLLQ